MFKNFMNKRATRRKECDYLLKYSFIGDDVATVFGAEVRDISINGFAIESKDVIKIGTVIQGELPFPFLENPIKFIGKVVRVQKLSGDKYIYGVSFDEIDKTGQENIGTYVEKMDLDALLASAIRKGATSVHLAVGCVPVCRVDGKILHMDVVLVSEEDIEGMVAAIINERQKAELYKNCELDFAYTLIKENRRFRMNVFFDKGHLAIAAKIVGSVIKSFEELGLPSILNDIVNKKSGLVIV
ncbi:MAG: PilZ domain-containing protein, partial [Candidatus Omnitrophica bacterium]|nr:PilZ domain-containing protein [Candidatus Omnitrophota bacterium]MBU1922801.1 PilZ domain-containing protein [Candidatus Omnitrophota bacterium]